MSSSSLRTTLDLAPAHAGAQGFAVSESVHGKALLQHPAYGTARVFAIASEHLRISCG
jgi:hypothetical protein